MSFTAYLWTLFTSALISSTVLPGGSEARIVVFVATAGNTLGALITYGMGRLIPNKKQEARSLELLKKYGPITLLFSWLPIVGDGFCLGAGWLRINFWRSFLLILLGKFVRYLVLAAVSLHMFS